MRAIACDEEFGFALSCFKRETPESLLEGKTKDVAYFERPSWEEYSAFAVYCLLKVEDKFI